MRRKLFDIRPGTVQPPKWGPGDVKDRLTIVSVGRHALHGFTKASWGYTVRCECGHEEFMTQPQIRERTECTECIADRKAKRYRRKARAVCDTKTSDGLRFERLKW